MDQIIIDANNSFILWQGCQIHKKEVTGLGLVEFIEFKKVKE
jgi:hypothetical protein